MVKYSSIWYKLRYSERLKKALDYLGGKCKKCPNTTNLHFHHKEPKEKSFTITEHLHGMAWDKMVIELDKCELLCKGCHKKEHKAKCGTESGYRNCKCDKCREAHRDYMRKYRNSKLVQ